MSSKIQIILNDHVDRGMIARALDASEPFAVDIVNNYQATDEPVTTIDVADLDSDYREALEKVVDLATWTIEGEDAKVFVIVQDGKMFNLEDSYVREETSTDGPLTALEEGTPLKVTFFTPGFDTENACVIDLWYGQAFNPVDVAALAAIGITLTGNGTEFTIANVIECKVAFSRPEVVTEVYVISYNLAGTIITV